jgi:hypothetical protein
LRHFVHLSVARRRVRSKGTQRCTDLAVRFSF